MTTGMLEPALLKRMNAYWRAANYLSVGQIYLYDNPLLKQQLALSDVKPLVVGHWGTTPGRELHLCAPEPGHQEVRPGHVLHRRPGHGGPALVGNTYLEGSYSSSTRHQPGRGRTQSAVHPVSFPGGISSHVAPTTPGGFTRAATGTH